MYGKFEAVSKIPDYFWLQRFWVISLAFLIKYVTLIIFSKKLSGYIIDLEIYIKHIWIKALFTFIFFIFFCFNYADIGFDGRAEIVKKAMHYIVESDNFIFYSDNDESINPNPAIET